MVEGLAIKDIQLRDPILTTTPDVSLFFSPSNTLWYLFRIASSTILRYYAAQGAHTLNPEPISEPACSKENPCMPFVHESRRKLIESARKRDDLENSGGSSSPHAPARSDSQQNKPKQAHEDLKRSHGTTLFSTKESSSKKSQPLNTSTVLSGAPVVYQVPKVVASSPPLAGKSEVIVLTNMVTPDDVDSELRREITEGCLAYGKILKHVIYEV